jgi:hypothetical protein
MTVMRWRALLREPQDGTPRHPYSSSGNPSISITSDMAASATRFFEPLPRCDFGLRFFLAFGAAAATRFTWHALHVQLGGCLFSDL